jgi:hypothetical protein
MGVIMSARSDVARANDWLTAVAVYLDFIGIVCDASIEARDW